MITRAERSRIRHAKGLCVGCNMPARQHEDGSFYWHCEPCQEVRSSRRKLKIVNDRRKRIAERETQKGSTTEPPNAQSQAQKQE